MRCLMVILEFSLTLTELSELELELMDVKNYL